MARDSESVGRGQKIMTETGPDKSTDKADREALHGRSFKGGPEDMSRSMKPNLYGSKSK